MKGKLLIGMFAVLAVALVASAALAGPGYGRGAGYGYGYGYGIHPVANLTPEQSTKIQAIQQGHLKEIAPLQQQLLAKKMELRACWLSQNPDQAKINALQKDILNLSTRIQEKATNARLEMRKVLTPQQQAQLTAYGQGMGYGMGRKGGRMVRW